MAEYNRAKLVKYFTSLENSILNTTAGSGAVRQSPSPSPGIDITSHVTYAATPDREYVRAIKKA